MANISNQNQVTERNASTQVHVVNPDTGTVIIPRRETEIVNITAPGPQGIPGVQGVPGDSVFSNLGGGVFATTSSIQVTGSFTVSGSSTFTNIGPAVFSGSVTINGAPAVTTATLSSLTASYATTASYAENSTFANNIQITNTTSSFGGPFFPVFTAVNNGYGGALVDTSIFIYTPTTNTLSVNIAGNISGSLTGSLLGTASLAISALNAGTASYLNNLNQDLTFNGNLTLNGTASIAYLNVQYETASVIYSSGSNQFGDAANDTQTLYGTVVIPTGSLTVSGSVSFGTSSAGFFWDNTNSRLGIGTATPATTLQIAGTTTTQNILVQTGATYDIGVSATRFRDGWFSRNVQCGSVWTANIAIAATNLTFYNTSVAVVGTLFGTGNLLLSTGTQTDAGYKLDVNGSVRATGSISAASLLARGTFLNQTLVATANNDVLVGLEINPTFTNGAFTGVKNNWINLVGNASVNFTNQLYLKRGDVDVLFASSAETQLKTVSSSAPLKFFVGSTSQYAQFFATTGNLLLQNGGTFTDAGFKLDVNGTARVSGALTANTLTLIGNTLFIASATVGGLFATRYTNSVSYSGGHIFTNSTTNISATSGDNITLQSVQGFAPTSGTATYTGFSIANTINQTGGANGITRGLYINPTLTAAADWRAIEVASGASILNGVVAINSTNISTGYALFVNGVIGASSLTLTQNLTMGENFAISNNGSQTIDIDANNDSTNAVFRVTANGTANELFRVNESGSFGIGTITPTNTLDVSGTVRLLSGGSYLTLNNSTYSELAYTAVNYFRANGASALINGPIIQFLVGGSEKVRVASTTGNFLINTTTDAGFKLDVNGNAKIKGSGATSATTSLRVENTNASASLVVLDNGFVGIDTTTPAYKLDVSGSARFKFTPSGADLFTIDGATTTRYFIVENSNGFVGIGNGYTTSATPATSVDIRGNTSIKGGSATVGNAFIVTNTTPTTLLTIQNNGQVAFTSPTITLAASQSAFSISPIISASNIVGGQYYGVSITPTFYQTTASQTGTAFRVAATFSQSSAVATGGSNIIADFGSTSAGSQLTVTDVTSGSIYMVNDVSGIPIIEATSNWDVNIYDFPNKVFEKTGTQVNIYGTMRISGSFILPLSQSATPQTGSAYWSGSLLFIYNGTRYMSSSFA